MIAKMSIILKHTRSLLKISISSLNTKTKVPTLDEFLQIKPRNQIAKFSEPGSIYDPPYIKKTIEYPTYPPLVLNFYSYNYIVVDAFYKYIEKLCDMLAIDVVEAYRMPLRSIEVKTFKPYSTATDSEFKLQRYHRCVHIGQTKATLVPLLYEAIQMNLPEGVTFEVAEPSNAHTQFRYVPEVQIDTLRNQLREIDDNN